MAVGKRTKKFSSTEKFQCEIPPPRFAPWTPEMSSEGNCKKKMRSSLGGHVSICMGCRSAINDPYILRVAPDMEWHAACLKCAHCHQFLDETCTCFVRDGKTYCKRDYCRLFGAKCDKCRGGFLRTDMVMRARTKIFHLDCFRCSSCEKQLLPGDEFALREECLFCRHDYDSIKEESNDEEVTDDNHNTDITCPVQLAEEPELASQETPSRPSTGGSGVSGGNTNGLEGERVPHTGVSRRETSGRVHKSEGKPTRVRTVLTEKQLHTLRTCYNANCRPDALMKEQLVEMTGLSPRVIRVWFQNKRCKDKKRAIFMKQAVLQHDKGNRYGPYGSMQGIPLVASPPSHPEQPGAPFDITAYQPPWKTLAEFALAHDLDRIDPNSPQYQQVLQQMHGYGGGDHEHPTSLLHLQPAPPGFTNLEDAMSLQLNAPAAFAPHGPPSNPPSHFPGTPSELSSTSSE